MVRLNIETNTSGAWKHFTCHTNARKLTTISTTYAMQTFIETTFFFFFLLAGCKMTNIRNAQFTLEFKATTTNIIHLFISQMRLKEMIVDDFNFTHFFLCDLTFSRKFLNLNISISSIFHFSHSFRLNNNNRIF